MTRDVSPDASALHDSSEHEVEPRALPDWMRRIHDVMPDIAADQLTRLRPPAGAQTRAAAVLMAFAGGDGDAHILLIERASTLRSHPGQAAFPGGAVDPDDDGPVAAALREAQEETALAPENVDVLGMLPELWLPPSGFAVTPVVGWMPSPAPVRVADPAEVARVQWLRLEALLDPRHRFTTRHPSGHVGPAFDVDGMFVWGFTAGLLSRLLDVAGLTRPWDAGQVRPLPARYQRPSGVTPPDGGSQTQEESEVEP